MGQAHLAGWIWPGSGPRGSGGAAGPWRLGWREVGLEWARPTWPAWLAWSTGRRLREAELSRAKTPAGLELLQRGRWPPAAARGGVAGAALGEVAGAGPARSGGAASSGLQRPPWTWRGSMAARERGRGEVGEKAENGGGRRGKEGAGREEEGAAARRPARWSAGGAAVASTG